jgi:hypothetical protein
MVYTKECYTKWASLYRYNVDDNTHMNNLCIESYKSSGTYRCNFDDLYLYLEQNEPHKLIFNNQKLIYNPEHKYKYHHIPLSCLVGENKV